MFTLPTETVKVFVEPAEIAQSIRGVLQGRSDSTNRGLPGLLLCQDFEQPCVEEVLGCVDPLYCEVSGSCCRYRLWKMR